MTRRYHLCISVRGMLHWSTRDTERQLRFFTKDNGTKFSGPVEFRDYLMDELAKGHEVLSTVQCDNFDFKTGCQGHKAPGVPDRPAE